MSAQTFPITESAPPSETPNPRALWLWLALLFALGVAAPFVRVPNLAVGFVLGLLLLVIYVLAMIGIALSVARWQMTTPSLLVCFALGILVWFIGRTLITNVLGPLNAYNFEHKQAPTLLQLLGGGSIRGLTDLALIATASFGGAIVARLVRAQNMVGPICALLALMDIWNVLFGGLLMLVLTSPETQNAAQKAFAGPGKLGAATASAHQVPISLPNIGFGDYFFLALLLAVLVRLNMNWRGAAKLAFPLIALTLLGTNFVPYLPGLVPIGLAAALPNLRYFKFTREEWFAQLYAAILVVVLTAILFFAVKSRLQSQAPPNAGNVNARR